MRRAATLLSLALVLGLSLVAAGCGGDDDDEAGGDTTTAATTEDGGGAAADCTGSIGVMAPITGDAASIGTEQLNFTKFAVSQYNEENGTSFELVEGDTQLDPAQASTVAQRFVSDDDILAVIGPAGSQEVEAVGPIFTREDMGFISGSATATALTGGDLPTFYRVVPNDAAQGPTIGEFIAGELEAESVFIVDDQTSYSTGLAESTTEALEEADVTVERDSVNQDQSDFSALVSRAAEADVVFLPWQLANKGQVFAQQLKEQGSDAVVFGSDGLFSADFTAEGSYVSSFAPDITAIESSADLVEGYEAEYGEFTSTFGPPMYAATQAALAAISAACEEGEPTRAAVAEQIGETDQPDSILGDSLSFDENGDVEGARFYIFRVLGGGDYEAADE